MRPSILLITAFGAGAGATRFQGRAGNWTVGQMVQTDSGPVNGHAAANASDVSEYLGIPFAQPPVGDLRWEAPVRYSGNASINGTSFGFSCPPQPQTSSSSLSNIGKANLTASGLLVLEDIAQIGDKWSEDCLTLNVWTKPQTGDAKKAVLVWIYGGGFQYGNTDNPSYNGQFIAEEEDVIVVSMNYRLNILGFPGAPSLTQNLGLLDQRMAVEWVRDNIAAFGGDSSRITLFGQSAGGASVDYHSFAWTSDPIVAGFIPQSGSLFGIGPSSAARSAGYWYNVSSALGCGNESSGEAAVLACMRTQNYTTLVNILTNATDGTVGGLGIGFGPTIDDVVVFSDYMTRAQTGNFIKRPMLIGNANYEAGLFQTVDAIGGIFEPQSFWDTFDLQGFTCPASTRANISIANGIPTWRYRWFGEFPNTRLTTYPDSGAWHASELPVLFAYTPPGSTIPPSTPEEISISSYLMGAWATFAKDPVNGLKNYGGGWPTYAPEADTLVRLAYQNITGTNLANPILYDAACSVTFPVTGAAANGTSANGTSGTPNSTSTSTGGPATVTVSGSGKVVVGYWLFALVLGTVYLV